MSFRSRNRVKTKKRSSPQFGTIFGRNLWDLLVLTGPFSSDHPALNSRSGDACTQFSIGERFYLYNTLFHLHLIYCISAWSSTFSTYLNPLQTLQNKAIKLIKGLSHWQSSTTAYKKLDILKINELFKFEIGKFLHRHFNNKLPLNFQNYFVGLHQIHSIDTRRQATGCNYCISLDKTSRMQRSLKYKGVVISNNIPSDVRKNTFRKFKSNYKEQLIVNY